MATDVLKGKGALAFTKTTHGLTNLSMMMPGWPARIDPDTLNPMSTAPLLAPAAGNGKCIAWSRVVPSLKLTALYPQRGNY
jgi:hypothetical protein